MKMPESRSNDPGRDGLKKLASGSTDGERTSKAARTKVSSDTHCLEDILLPRRQSEEVEDVEEKRTVRARDVKHGVVLPLV